MPYHLHLGQTPRAIEAPSIGRSAPPARRTAQTLAPKRPARSRPALQTRAAQEPAPANPSICRPLDAAVGSLSFQERLGHLRTWLRSIESAPAHSIVEALGQYSADVQFEVLETLGSSLPGQATDRLLTAFLEGHVSPWIRSAAARTAYYMRHGAPGQALRRLIVEDGQPNVRAADLDYQTPARPGLMDGLQDPSPTLRLRAAMLVMRDPGALIALSTYLVGEPTPWVVHGALRGLCESHPNLAWRLWTVLPSAVRLAPTLAMLHRYAAAAAAAQKESSEASVRQVSGHLQAALHLLADSLTGVDCDRAQAVATAGPAVEGLVAQGDADSLELALAVVDRCVTAKAPAHLKAALAALRAHPATFLRATLPHVGTSDGAVLCVLAELLPGLATEVDARAAMRFLARHRFDAVRAAACPGLPSVARACPQQRGDVLAILRQNSACGSAEASVAACKALWDLGTDAPELAEEAHLTTRQLAREGMAPARISALELLQDATDLESALVIVRASQSTWPDERHAAWRVQGARLAHGWRGLSMENAVRQAQDMAQESEGEQRVVLAHALAAHLPRARVGEAHPLLDGAWVLGRLGWDNAEITGQLDIIRLQAMPALLTALPNDPEMMEVLTLWADALTSIDAAGLRALNACQAAGKDELLLAMVRNPCTRDAAQRMLAALWGLGNDL